MKMKVKVRKRELKSKKENEKEKRKRKREKENESEKKRMKKGKKPHNEKPIMHLPFLLFLCSSDFFPSTFLISSTLGSTPLFYRNLSVGVL